ncbi:MAG: chromosomal replication initiator protein DnaA [Candidatus Berkelbacteria bacterium]|nr:chromosomal replication initiator protein DnaA [Candidatus Berkelbacteria bacterium]
MVVSNNNALAYAVAQEVAKNPGKKHNPFFIYGGVGLGKTHLAQAVGQEVKKTNARAKVFYVSCETFTNDFIAAISSKRMSEFKKSYRDVDVLIVDDVQFLSSKEGSQQEFFHTFNSLQQKSRQMILTADKTPQAIPALENRLASRFGGGMVVDIQPPDFETRVAILTEKCKEKGAYLPDDVIDFLARNIVSNIRELEGALNRLTIHCQFNGHTPTIQIAESVLRDIISSTSKKIDTAEIIASVCKFYSLTKEDIVSGVRKKELIVPRQITVYLIREQTKKSLPEIGKLMGGKDHTTIMHSQKRIAQLIKIDAEIKRAVEQIREMVFKI